MVDSHRTVDDIRAFLNGGNQTFRDGLRELASADADACREANERLRRCEEFLNKGLRSEAIQLAEIEPVLLDLLAVLDFPERSRWEELSALYKLPAAGPLRLSSATILNRAYAEEQPLVPLLRQHRRLALMRAPLVARLEVLRQLARADRMNAIWGQQIGELERARHGQLQAAAEQALARDDLHGLFAVWDEIEKTLWQEHPPESMVITLSREVAQRVHLRAGVELERLAGELVAAHTANDAERARRLLEDWDRFSQEVMLKPEDPLNKRVTPVKRWVAAQDRRQSEALAYQADLEKLEQALDAKTPAGKLEMLYEAVRGHPRGVPAPLEQRYRAHQETVARRARRRKQIILAVIVGCSLLGLGLLLFR
jgi:hypothetical protein